VITHDWIVAWAGKYGSEYDEKWIVPILGKPHPTYGDIEHAYRWKNARGIRFFEGNDRAEVVRRVHQALETSDEAIALATLIRLRGVKARVASAILAVFRPERYTVMDWRAWETLRQHGLLSNLEEMSWEGRWPGYLVVCRKIKQQNGVSFRDLDRALWAARGSTSMPSG
jgi:hypothetical protein